MIQMIYLNTFIMRKHKPWKLEFQLHVITSVADDLCRAEMTAQALIIAICAMTIIAMSALLIKTQPVRQIATELILPTAPRRIQTNDAVTTTSTTIPWYVVMNFIPAEPQGVKFVRSQLTTKLAPNVKQIPSNSLELRSMFALIPVLRVLTKIRVISFARDQQRRSLTMT